MANLISKECKKMFQTGKGMLIVGILFSLSIIYVWGCIYSTDISDSYSPSKYMQAVSSVDESDLNTSLEKITIRIDDLQSAGYGYAAYSAYADVKIELEQVIHYPELLDQIKNVDKKQTLSSIAESDYEKKNKMSVKRQYEDLEASCVNFAGARGIKLFLQTDFCDVFLSLMTVFLVVILVTVEYESGMLELVSSSKTGLRKTAVVKAWIGIVAVTLVTCLVSLIKLFLYTRAYGFTEWEAPIQSVVGYAASSFHGSISEFVLVSILQKVFGYWIQFALFLVIATFSKKSWKFLFCSGIITAVAFLCIWWIDGNSWLIFLKRFNPFIYIQVDYLLSNYQNINVMGYPVSYYKISLIVGVLFLASTIVYSIAKFGQRAMLSSKNVKTGKILSAVYSLLDKVRIQTITLWEMRKGLLYERGVLILVFSVLLVILTYSPIEESIKDKNELHYKEYITQIQGGYSVEKSNFLKEEKERLATLQKDIDENGIDYTYEALELYNKQLEKQMALKKVIEYDEYLKKVSKADYVYERGYEMLLGKKIPGSYLLLCNVFATFLMVVLSIAVWGMEEWSGMDQICNIALHGKKKQIRAKRSLVFCYAVLVFLIIYIPWFHNVSTTYQLSQWGAAAQSIRLLAKVPAGISIGILVGVYYFIHFLYLIFVGLSSRILHRIFHNYAVTGIVGVALFLLPFLLL